MDADLSEQARLLDLRGDSNRFEYKHWYDKDARSLDLDRMAAIDISPL